MQSFWRRLPSCEFWKVKQCHSLKNYSRKGLAVWSGAAENLTCSTDTYSWYQLFLYGFCLRSISIEWYTSSRLIVLSMDRHISFMQAEAKLRKCKVERWEIYFTFFCYERIYQWADSFYTLEYLSLIVVIFRQLHFFWELVPTLLFLEIFAFICQSQVQPCQCRYSCFEYISIS